jgi:hypothetical protein
MPLHPTQRFAASVAVALAAACGGEQPAPEPESTTPAAGATAEPSASVTIAEPAEGDTVSGDSLQVALSASGVRIVPAGDTTAGTGHHHLYLDQDLGQPGEIVPTVAGQVVHLGTGAETHVFTDVPAGEHRLIAVVADGLHVPLQPWVTDTVRFVVR